MKKSLSCLLLVFLAATTTLPAGIVVEPLNSTTSLAYAADAKSNDLINAGQSTLSSSSVSASNASFSGSGINNGAYSNTTTDNTWFQSGTHFPATATYNLNLTDAPDGYTINSITSLMGWYSNSQIQANQKYTVEVSLTNSPDFQALATVNYAPFTGNGGIYETKVVVRDDASVPLITNVDAIRFVFNDPGNTGTNPGTVVREIDVIGFPANVPVGITSPGQRFLVQRNASNTGTIPITGFCAGTPDRIEAQAVVMAGANSGTTTGWQVIANNPTGNLFAGNLTNVAAGGWYRLEVRSVTDETESPIATVDKVGVGDIYVTAGQSNSANHGAPAYTPSDDRVSVRTAVSGSNWRHGYDPMPIATGTGGSAWSRLGDLLVSADNIPIGFLCVGVGGTQLSTWQPGQTNYVNNLKPAVQSLPAGGFRAVLWHQGESDSIANVNATTHSNQLAAMIAQSRLDAGWAVPWYVAEVSFHPNTNLSQEEPVTAGQRMAVFADANVFLGPSTDPFHLEDANGGKLSDTVHFNAAGLLDHATQWRDILRGTTSLAPRNGDFEENRNPAVTGLSPLADGGIHTINATGDNDSPSVIGWRVLSTAGTTAADGTNGFFNPAAGTYAAAIDTSNNGVLPNMSGRHVAFLQDGSAGNGFLHTTRAIVQPNTAYTVTAAIGVRDVAATFGGATLELLADGQVLATTTFDKAALDALRGGDSAGSFTNASVSFTTGASVPAGQPLAVRIAKPGAAGTVLDFDNVRLTASVMTDSQAWNTGGPSDVWNAGGDTNWDSGVAWTNGNNAIFAGPGEPITVDTVVANNLSFTGNDYSLNGGSIQLNNPGSSIDIGSGLSAAVGSSITVGNGIAKTGAGTLVLTGSNTLNGTTNVSAGTLEIGGAGTLGSGNHAGAISNSGTLKFNSSAAQTLSGVVSGSGDLVKSGSSNLTLTNTNTYTGTTTISGGTLQVGNGGGTGSLATPISITSPGKLTLFRSGNGITFGNVVSGTGTWELKGDGSSLNGGYDTISGNNSGFSGNLIVTNARMVLDNANDIGAATVTLNNGGQLALNAGTYSNAATITGNGWLESAGNLGVLRFAGGSTWAGPVTLAGDSRITANAAGDTGTISGAISGGFGLTKTGSGTITLSGTNSYTGTTTISAGTLSLNSTAPTVLGNLIMNGPDGTYAKMQQPNQFGPGVVANFTSAWAAWNRFDLSGKNQVLAGINTGTESAQGGGVIQVLESGTAPATTLTLDGSGTSYVFSGHLRNGGTSNTLAIAKSGPGTQTFAYDKIDYTGATTVSGGTLKLYNTINFASNITNSATVEFPGTGRVTNTAAQTLSGAGIYRKTGPGDVTLYNDTVTATGQFYIEGGKFRNDGNSCVWTACTADMDISATATLDLFADDIYVDALTGAGTVDNGFNQPQKLTVGVAGGGGTFSGIIKNTSNVLSFVKTGGGTQELSGTNTYTGTTTLAGGVLSVSLIGNGGVAGNLGAATVAAGNLVFDGGALRYTGATASTNRNFTINAGKTATFDITGAGAALTVSGSSAATTGALTKTGAGTLVLTGANTYTGNTSVNAGVLTVPAIQSSPNFTVADGARLNVTGGGASFNVTSLTLGTGGATTMGIANFVGQTTAATAPVRVSTTLAATGVVTLNVRGNFSGSGTYPLIAYPTSYVAGTTPFSLVLPPNVSGSLVDNPANKTIDLVVASVSALTWEGSVSGGAWDIDTTANWKPAAFAADGKYQDGMVVRFDGTAAGTTTVDLPGLVTPSGITVDNAVGSPYIIGGTGSIAGATTLTKMGAGTLTLSTANSYTGATIANAGVLKLGNAAALGSAASASVAFGAGSTGTLQLNGNNLALAGLNTNLVAGTPVLENGLAGTANLTLNSAVANTYAGVLQNGAAGTLALTKGGSGSLTLGGANANTYTGTTTVTGGALILSKAAGTAAVPGNLVIYGNAANVWATANNQLSSSTLVSNGNNTAWACFTLNGTTQTIGGLDNPANNLMVANSTTSNTPMPSPTGSGAGVLILAGSGNYVFGGDLWNAWNSVAGTGGTLGLTLNMAPGGSQTLSGVQITYTGATQISSGKLSLSGTTGFTSTTTVENGTSLEVINAANQGMNAAITLKNGATLKHSGTNATAQFWTNSQAVSVASGASVTIHQNSVANTTGTNKSAFLDGGLKGGGSGAVLTLNATNAGNAVVFRNNNSNFAGKVIVNGIASATNNAGSGIAVNGATTGLQNADIELNGTMELADQTTGGGLGWAANGAGSSFSMGALTGTGVATSNGQAKTLNLGNTNTTADFSGTLANGSLASSLLHLTKSGTGTQTLSGTNTYSGATAINGGGILRIASTGSLTSSGTANQTIDNGTLDVNGTVSITGASGALLSGAAGSTGTLNVNSGASFTFDKANNNGIGLGNGNGGTGIINLNGGSLTMTGDDTFLAGFATSSTGTVNVNSGTLSLGLNGNFTLGSATSSTATVNLNGGTLSTARNVVKGPGSATFNFNGGTLQAGLTSTTFMTGLTAANVRNGGAVVDANGNNVTIGQALVHSTIGGDAAIDGGLTKTGSGTLTLSNSNNTYTGTTTVSDGTLLVNGSTHASSAVSVGAIGTLGGTGTVNGTVSASGTLAPGTTGTGTLNTGAVTLTGTYACQLDGANCDKLVSTGSLTLTGATLAISTITAPTAPSYLIATYTGSTPTFTTVTGLPSGYVVDTSTAGQIKLVNGYAAWAASMGLTGANGGKMQDPDGDNHSNLEEFAFGTDPLTSSSGSLTYSGGVLTAHGQPTTSITNLPNGVDYRAVFCRRKDYLAAGLTYTVQFSVDLTNWVNSTDTPTVVASDAEFDAVSVPYPLFITTPRGAEKPTFFRVAVTSNP